MGSKHPIQPVRIVEDLTGTATADNVNVNAWGGTATTGRDITGDIRALSDDAIKGVMRTLGDAGAAASDSTGKTVLKELDDILNALDSIKITDGTETVDVNTNNHLEISIEEDNVGIGGGTQYTEGDTDATIKGNALIAEGTSDTLRAVRVDDDGALHISDGGNTITVDGSVNNADIPTLDTDANDYLNIDIQADNAGLATSAKQDTIEATLTNIETAIQILDDWDNADKADINIADASISDGTYIGDIKFGEGLPTGSNTIGKIKLTDGTEDADINANNHLEISIEEDNVGIGGGTQYDEGDTDASITGNAMLAEGTSDTLKAVRCDDDGALHISDGGNTVTVDGTVSANSTLQTGSNTVGKVHLTDGSEDASINASNELEVAETNSSDILTALQIMDDWDNGSDQCNIDIAADSVGLATSAKQDTMITALEKIDDLQNALDSVGTDELDVNVESSVLPTGAATEASLSSIDGHVPQLDTDGSNYLNVDIQADNAGLATSSNQSTANSHLNAIKTAVQIIDDWDNSNKCDINIADASISDGTYIGDIKFGESIPAGTNEIGEVVSKRGEPDYTKVVHDTQSADASSGANVWDPTGGTKFVLTDIIVSTDTAMNVEIKDGANVIIKVYLAANGGFVSNFQTPIESTAADNVLSINTSTSGNISVTATGYEV